MYIAIEVDIDEIVNEHTGEVLEALRRNDHHVSDTAEVLSNLKEVRQKLTTLIRTIEQE
jgi:hypothetical protein